METRARYILVGIFTLLSLVAALGFILWLAKVQIDRTYAQYDIVFDTVAGLGQASAVQYNGVDVGKVLNIALDRFDPSLVRVRIEIYASTPIRQDTMATLASMGVTGVSFVALAGGSADAERLAVIPPADVPVIASKPSVVQGLILDAPTLLAEAILLMRDIRSFTTPANGAAITAILTNIEEATARMDGLASRSDAVMIAAEATMARADNALLAAQTAFGTANAVIGDELPALLATMRGALDDLRGATARIEAFSRTGLPQYSALAQDGRALVATIGAIASRIGSDPGRFLLGNQTPAYRN
jgi:phospholipid/cholesterol/gamma-HCH transport system substrate-binding protein